MTKRFCATERWDDPWYRRLSPVEKCFWEYICSRCDNAGFWKIDFDLAAFAIGSVVTIDILPTINAGKKRVTDLGDFLYIHDFIDFQIGDLSGENQTNLQKNCLALIHKHINHQHVAKDFFEFVTGSVPVAMTIGTGIGKGKGKGNTKQPLQPPIKIVKKSNMTNVLGSDTKIPPEIEAVRAYCTERSNAIDPQQWYDFYEAKGWMIGKNKIKDWRACVRTWEAKNKQENPYAHLDPIFHPKSYKKRNPGH